MARRTPAGFTLIEVMLAMALMLIGSIGLLSLHRMGVQMNSDARRTTRATALAEDLLTQMQSWDYAHDERLVNTNASNDAMYSDPHVGANTFDVGGDTGDNGKPDPALYDHEESELEDGGNRSWLGVPTAQAQAAGFTRYWNVTALTADNDANNVLSGMRVAVFVVWQRNGVRRHVMLTSFIRNPQVTN